MFATSQATKPKKVEKSPVQRRYKVYERKRKFAVVKSWLHFFATDKITVPPKVVTQKTKNNLKDLKVAIVADWLTNMGGAERVVLSLHKAFPNAPIYTSVFEADKMPLFRGLDVRTTYLQRLPKFLRSRHQLFAVLRTRAFRQLNLDAYDVVISSSSAESKAVLTPAKTTHICYCHTPIRYYWSHYHEYVKNPGFGVIDPLVRLMLPLLVKVMRRTDLKAVESVDYFIANSKTVQKRIKKYYNRPSDVIFPPVAVDRFTGTPPPKEDFYLIVGRQIPYKRHDLAVAACSKLGKKLIVIGNGSEHQRLKSMAGDTVEFLTNVDDTQIVSYFQRARALLWPQVEDFGVTAVEALAAGTPVVALRAGGALDFMKEGVTGTFFDKQDVDSLCDAIREIEAKHFDSKAIQRHAQAFSEENFIKEVRNFVNDKVTNQ